MGEMLGKIKKDDKTLAILVTICFNIVAGHFDCPDYSKLNCNI